MGRIFTCKGASQVRELTGIMLQQEADEPFVGTQWCAVDDQRSAWVHCLHRYIPAGIFCPGQNPPGWWPGELTSDGAPYLHINLRAIESALIGNFHKWNIAFFQHLAYHLFGFEPKLRFIDILLTELGRLVRGLVSSRIYRSRRC